MANKSGGKTNIGGVPGSQHNDWGHSPVPTGGNQQSGAGAGNTQVSGGRGLKRQGVMPGEEMGHLNSVQKGKSSKGKGGAGRG
jgi:hypothetical protein